MPELTEQHEEISELERVLSSDVFVKSPNLSRLLGYLCRKYFEGRTSELKEYNIGVEAMGRPADFDPALNSVVRVEAHRLREKLKKYYEGEGVGNSIRITIDPGRYVPRFVHSSDVATGKGDARPESVNFPQAQPAVTTQNAGELAESSVKSSGHWVKLLIFCSLAVAGFLLVAFLRWQRRPSTENKLAAPDQTQRMASGPPPTTATESVRILCGYTKDKFIDRSGNTWLGDRYFTGGSANSQEPQFIARAADIGLFQTFRTGNFSYDIPLKQGNYELRLYFCETHYGPGAISGGGETSRLFNVSMNGKPLLHIFDIIKDAGGNNTGDIRVFRDVSPAEDGRLHLTFESLNDSPIINAIEIEPAPQGRINPIRIVAQNNSYTDHLGNIWSPDRYFSGGQQAMHITRKVVSGTEDPTLFVGERFGNFSYAIPVAPGKYSATLRFAETYWGDEARTPSLPDQNGSLRGGVGSRIFDVYCNGVALLQNFDIAKEAGGPVIALTKTFHNLKPNAQGKLVLHFVPVKDYACVTALEVLDESE